jgi:hypothetical protein
MATPYPSFTPETIEFQLGKYSASVAVAPAGSTTLRPRSTLQYGFQVRLSYGLISDNRAAQILSAWFAARGIFGKLILPLNILDAVGAEFIDVLPDYADWYFAGPPQITSSTDAPEYSTVNVVLEAEY